MACWRVWCATNGLAVNSRSTQSLPRTIAACCVGLIYDSTLHTAAYRQTAAVTLARHSSQQPAQSVGADAEELKRRAVPGYENLLQDDK